MLGKIATKVKKLLVKITGDNQSRDPESRGFGARSREIVPNRSFSEKIPLPDAGGPVRRGSHGDHLWSRTRPTEEQDGCLSGNCAEEGESKNGREVSNSWRERGTANSPLTEPGSHGRLKETNLPPLGQHHDCLLYTSPRPRDS